VVGSAGSDEKVCGISAKNWSRTAL
jgi:hypothetical protein